MAQDNKDQINKDQVKQPVIIKKYANRRLYHTGTSTYVTLEDLGEMVRLGEDFVVTDAKTGEDITRSVLTQIIFEEESKGQNLLPIAFLRQLIRFYGDSMQALVPSYLEFSIDNLTKEQQRLRDMMSHAFGGGALQAVQDQVRANMKIFAEGLRIFTPFAPPRPTETPPQASDNQSSGADDLGEIKRQMAEMQAKLDQLAKK